MGVKICHFSKSKPKIFPRHLIYIHWGEKYENICWHFWDWLIVALSGLRGKRPMRRSGKKLPTFCVFCKVWILILNISLNKTNSKWRNCNFFFKVRAIPFHHFPTHNKLINSNSSFISVAACHSPHAFVKNKKKLYFNFNVMCSPLVCFLRFLFFNLSVWVFCLLNNAFIFNFLHLDSQLPSLISLFIFVWSISEADPKNNWIRGEQACLVICSQCPTLFIKSFSRPIRNKITLQKCSLLFRLRIEIYIQ